MLTRPILALLCLSIAVALATPQRAAASFETGIAAPEYSELDETLRDDWFDTTVDLDAGIVRVAMSWRTVVTGQPADPADPFDPAYDFTPYDAAVREAAERGLDVMLTITFAPDYAEAPGRPGSVRAGTWRPDPAAYASFAEAVASRYSGAAGLPRVRYYQAWNEPNLSVYLNPQWNGSAAVSPAHYRDMLNAFYTAVNGVDPANVVVSAGNSPYGDEPGTDRMRPLRFDRELFCLRKNLKPEQGCGKVSFDVFAHHPINTSGGPRLSAIDPDDASTPDFKNVRKTLRAAERARTVDGPRRHKLWATEIWWESDPPDSTYGVGLKKHARWIQEGIYVLWKQGAKAVIYFLLRDPDGFNPDAPEFTVETGLFFRNGKPKPAARAFGFPFVTERKTERLLLAWGKAPESGKLRIEERVGGGWRTIEKLQVREGKVFTRKLQVRGKAKLRAEVGGEKSLVWSQRS